MSRYDGGFKLKKMERRGYCRGCDKDIPIGEDIIHTETLAGNGAAVLICMNCAKKIGELIDG